MRRMTYFVMALALVLGFTQCKKEQPAQNETEGVRITLTVDGGSSNSRVIVNPTGHTDPDYATVTFENGDVIYVGNNGHYCGYIQHNGTNFTGTIDDTDLSESDYLHFYFMGNKGTTSEPTEGVSITDQTSKYPVISYAHSTEKYASGTTSYSAKLQNYCAIVKFTTTDIDADITITGMNNTVAVDFGANNAANEAGIGNNPYTPSKTGDGEITLHRVSNTERWAILLPQNPVPGATVTIGSDHFVVDLPAITANAYITSGVEIKDPMTMPLTLAALSDGTITVSDPKSGMQYSKNGENKQTMSGPVSIDVTAGDKVAFYGNGTSINNYNGTKITGGTADVKVYGNIMSLVDEVNFATVTTLPGTVYTFSQLFAGYEHLTDASGLLLPATTLNHADAYCYNQMFTHCTNLVAAPSELPATKLVNNCYQEMFVSCTSLTVAPILPATNLASDCYNKMFRDCTSLKVAPVLPAEMLDESCYLGMFYGCSSLESITCLAIDYINLNRSTYQWVRSVASSGTFFKASEASVDSGTGGKYWPSGVHGIPSGWTVQDYSAIRH